MKAWLVALVLCAAGAVAHAQSAAPLPAPFNLPGQGSANVLPAPIALPVPVAPSTTTQPAHDSTDATKNNTLFAIKVIAGLIILMVLAYLGGHRSVVRFQERLGIGGVITAGFPFVALGALASHPDIAILNHDV